MLPHRAAPAPRGDLYIYLEARPFELEPLEGLVLEGLRTWAAAAMAGCCPVRVMAPRFVLAGEARLVAPFHAFMVALAGAAARPLQIHRNPQGRATEDEALLLTALAALGQRDMGRAHLALRNLMRADALSGLLHEAAQFAFAMGARHPGPAASQDRVRRAG